MSGLAVTLRKQVWPRALLAVLHTAAEATLALHLIQAWAPMMPAGDLVPAPTSSFSTVSMLL